ncbi:MAG: hypothetical protein OIN87_11155 [Candidatus Methanoperedens sp.]|nr:hypothetical protein [Candidatus Methanoperedens sp.]
MNSVQKFLIIGSLLIGIIFMSGCVQEKEQTSSADSANKDKTSSSLESRINELEKKVDELDKTNSYNGIMKQSPENLIPLPPFKIIIHFKKGWTYYFRENNELEITKDDPIPSRATYTIDNKNNTIKISPPKANSGIKFNDFDPYWIRLFEEYASVTYENGWMDWVARYDIQK